MLASQEADEVEQLVKVRELPLKLEFANPLQVSHGSQEFDRLLLEPGPDLFKEDSREMDYKLQVDG